MENKLYSWIKCEVTLEQKINKCVVMALSRVEKADIWTAVKQRWSVCEAQAWTWIRLSAKPLVDQGICLICDQMCKISVCRGRAAPSLLNMMGRLINQMFIPQADLKPFALFRGNILEGNVGNIKAEQKTPTANRGDITFFGCGVKKRLDKI